MNLRIIKHLVVFSCFLLLTAFTVRALAQNSQVLNSALQSQKYRQHTISKSETVYSIARQYNVTVADLYVLNPKAEEGIKVGDVLKVPDLGNTQASDTSSSTTREYSVKSKETLYSIAKQHGVKVEDIIDANPTLKSKPLFDGQVLTIPLLIKAAPQNNAVPTTMSLASAPVVAAPTMLRSQLLTHKVESKETIYGISKKYNITVDNLMDLNPTLKEGLKDGSTLIIPAMGAVTTTSQGNTNVGTLREVNTVSVGLVLPFINKSSGQSARFVEYYEGFLLALEEMKSKGMSVNVYAFDMGSDTGTTKLNSLLDTYEMKYLDLIIGGVSTEQVAAISAFAKKNNVKYVIPFPTKTEEVQSNPLIYQVNSPHLGLYNNVANVFVGMFPSANVIYIKDKGSDGDRAELITALNGRLSQYGMAANTILVSNTLASDLSAALDQGRRNIIVPSSAAVKMLQALSPALKSVITERPDLKISLFGHTDWQTYTQFFDDFAKFNTYIYTPFFMNDNDLETRKFISNYQRWYSNKSLINTYPKYGALGYDTGITFLSALKKDGKNFVMDTKSSTPTIQTPFVFKKANFTGGYLNAGFYVVHFKSDGSIEKTECGR